MSFEFKKCPIEGLYEVFPKVFGDKRGYFFEVYSEKDFNAAGLTMKPENYPIFKERFEKFVDEHINPLQLAQTIHIDSELELSDITTDFRKNLQ